MMTTRMLKPRTFCDPIHLPLLRQTYLIITVRGSQVTLQEITQSSQPMWLLMICKWSLNCVDFLIINNYMNQRWSKSEEMCGIKLTFFLCLCYHQNFTKYKISNCKRIYWWRNMKQYTNHSNISYVIVEAISACRNKYYSPQ